VYVIWLKRPSPITGRFAQQGIEGIEAGAVKGNGGGAENRAREVGQNAARGEFQMQPCAAFAGALDGGVPVYLPRHIEGEVFGNGSRVTERAGAGAAQVSQAWRMQ